MGWHKQFKLMMSLSVLLFFNSFLAGSSFAKEESLIPMGHSISIQMELTGVFITNDLWINKNGWLETGDFIQKLNDVEIKDVESFLLQFKKEKSHQSYTIQVVRNGAPFKLEVDRAFIQRLIPFLKDRTDGTGTLTYVDPEKKIYGALGHQIVDNSLKSPPSFKHGSIYLATIEQIRKSTPGDPGYKVSSIVKNKEMLGSIQKNIVYGIFGTWEESSFKVMNEPIAVLKQEEIEIGDAEVYTTIFGTNVEKFKIKITNIEEDQFHFVLADDNLIRKTGGILQGMSGSPIIQHGKFAGAITHMFIDEPEKGAAIFMQTMKSGQ